MVEPACLCSEDPDVVPLCPDEVRLLPPDGVLEFDVIDFDRLDEPFEVFDFFCMTLSLLYLSRT